MKRIAILMSLAFGLLGGIVIGVSIPQVSAEKAKSGVVTVTATSSTITIPNGTITVYEPGKPPVKITDPQIVKWIELAQEETRSWAFSEGYLCGFEDGRAYARDVMKKGNKAKKPFWDAGVVPSSRVEVEKQRKAAR